MKKIGKYWLEIIFIALLIFIICVSVKNTALRIPIDYGKKLGVSSKTLLSGGLNEYIEELRQLDDCTTVFTLRESQGYYITEEDIEAMKELGFDQADVLADGECHSFIGIILNGEVIYQDIGYDEYLMFGQYISNHYFFVTSATFDAGDMGEVYIDNTQYSVNGRGLNIVTVDNSDFSIIDSINFDVFEEDVPVYRLIDGQLTFIDSAKGN